MQTSHAPPKQSIAGATTNHEPPAEKVWPVQPHLSAPPCIPKYPPPSNSSWKSIPSLERNKYVLCIIYDCIYIWIPLHCIYMKVNFKGSCFFVKPTRNLSLFPGSTWLASHPGDHHCLNNFQSAADLLLLLSIINWSSNFSAKATARALNSADDDDVWSWS